jgi:hypothetical protein
MLLQLGEVGYINRLITRSHGAEAIADFLVQHAFESLNEVKQGYSVCGTAAHVVDLTCGPVAVLPNRGESAQQILHGENVSNLAAISVNGDCYLLQC